MKTHSDWTVENTRTATIRAGSNRFFFLDADYYYVACATSSTTMQIDKISRDDFSVTTADITVSGVSLCTEAISGSSQWMPLFAFDGTYLYFPASGRTHFIKINIGTPADVAELSGTLPNIDLGSTYEQVSNGGARANPIVLSSGLVVGSNYIINDQKNYPIARVNGIGNSGGYMAYGSWLQLVRHGAACYGHAFQSYSSSSAWSGQANVLFPYFLSTINNLENPITKSTAQTMKVEYTIQEA